MKWYQVSTNKSLPQRPTSQKIYIDIYCKEKNKMPFIVVSYFFQSYICHKCRHNKCHITSPRVLHTPRHTLCWDLVGLQPFGDRLFCGLCILLAFGSSPCSSAPWRWGGSFVPIGLLSLTLSPQLSLLPPLLHFFNLFCKQSLEWRDEPRKDSEVSDTNLAMRHEAKNVKEKLGHPRWRESAC